MELPFRTSFAHFVQALRFIQFGCFARILESRVTSYWA
jgi:hypothetical protein